MDLIYTNSAWEDIGVIKAGELDMDVGGTNDFELIVPKNEYPDLGVNSLIYFDGTEFGGIVNGVSFDTEENTLTLNGYTWQDILNHKIIEPDEGEDYYETNANEDAHSAVLNILTRCDLLDLFCVPGAESGILVDEYKFERYTTVYQGLKKMAEDNGAKLIFQKGLIDGENVDTQSKVVISVVPIIDYTTDDYSSDQYSVTISRSPRQTNHLICLGQGELAERTVIHLYLDADGNVSQTQTFTGIDEITETYENTNDDENALLEDGTNHLKELYSSDEAVLQLNDSETIRDVGDIVVITDYELAIELSAPIARKVLSYDNGYVTIECQIGG